MELLKKYSNIIAYKELSLEMKIFQAVSYCNNMS